jgi:hypothetical protein
MTAEEAGEASSDWMEEWELSKEMAGSLEACGSKAMRYLGVWFE